MRDQLDPRATRGGQLGGRLDRVVHLVVQQGDVPLPISVGKAATWPMEVDAVITVGRPNSPDSVSSASRYSGEEV